MNGYIYKITNKTNNKIYVGMTSNINFRWKYGHIRTAKKLINGENIGYKSLLYDAMKKYGIDNFSIEIIEECPIEIMGEREELWIEKLKSRDPSIGYNICRGGSRGPGGPMFSGHKHSEETRCQMSANRKGDRNSNYGNRWSQSQELRDLHSKLSSGENNGMFGKKQSDESNRKNKEAHLGRRRMSNEEIYPKFKMIPKEDIEEYLKNGWFLLK